MLSDGSDVKGATWKRGVRDAIYDHVFSDLDHEVGGFLIGHLRNDGRVAVRGAVAALRADGHTASLTFTHDAWEDVHRELEERFPGEAIVGWYHSHPGFGVFLSENDLFIHRNFFSGAHQLAYVVDPHAGQEGIFAWRDGHVVSVGQVPTKRPAEKPRRPDPATPPHEGYPPRALALLVTLGVAIGAGAWLTAGGGNASTDTPPTRTTVTTQITTHAQEPRRRVRRGETSPAPRVCTPEAGQSQQC